jgi:hypothetical protein
MSIISTIIITIIMHVFFGVAIITCPMINFTKFESDHKVLIASVGLIYWILKLITYPILIPYRKSKNKREAIKKQNEKLIKSVQKAFNNFVDMDNLDDCIKDLKGSMSTDLYSRASDSYRDMISILIKCSDGEGKIDIENFGDIIKKSIQECYEVIKVAWEEMDSRINEEKKNYYKDKKESIKQDLENMINKNKEFKNMWKEEI